MQIKTIAAVLDAWAPLRYAEDFDNVGLLVGNADNECTGVLVAHDVSVDVVKEAKAKKANLIVCFHPILFQPIKKLTGKTYVEKTLISAIENQCAIYAIHTALDNQKHGISYHLGKTLELNHQQILLPKADTLLHLRTYVPTTAKEEVLNALHEAGAGELGNYSHCSFSTEGEGRFKGNENSDPQVGQKGEITSVEEAQINVLVPMHLKSNILQALQSTHPYESVAYELIQLENNSDVLGMGSIGYLPQPETVASFLKRVKNKLNIPYLRHSETTKETIHKVAVLGGSGSFCIDAAKAQNADALVTADLKYHDFFKGEKTFLIVDAGHYETEHFTKKIIHQYLTKKIPNFAITLSDVKTNPVKYF